MYHYTYLLIDDVNTMLYIGRRSSKCLPEKDIEYLGSSKYVPKHLCDKIVLNTFSTLTEAIQDEVTLHALYNVKDNKLFYNKANQTTTKFEFSSAGVKKPAWVGKRISKAKKGKVPNWSDEGRAIIYNNLNKPKSKETIKKQVASRLSSPKARGITSVKFKPWYITTETVTYLFYDITKNDLSLKEGHYRKYYADLQKKFRVHTKKYGKILHMGFLPETYRYYSNLKI